MKPDYEDDHLEDYWLDMTQEHEDTLFEQLMTCDIPCPTCGGDGETVPFAEDCHACPFGRIPRTASNRS